MLVADLVHRRIANFWGYGSFAAPVWFVGMEEGLGPETELEERFRATDGKATIDMRRDMARVPHHMRWFQPPSLPIQQTWKYPIALYLFLRNGIGPPAEEVRAYQRDVLVPSATETRVSLSLCRSRREAPATAIGHIWALSEAGSSTWKHTSRHEFDSYGH